MTSSANQRPIPITALQIFWGVWAAAGLICVGWAAWRVPPGAATFIAEIGASWSAITVALDLLFLGVAAVAFAVVESRRLGFRAPWIWIPLAIPIPGAFLIPFFFLLRERALAHARANDKPADRSGA